jgi:uncharacterized membrane protein YhaH (DUF805 family)
MSTNTPYNPPKSAVADMAHEFGELKVFSAKGRIGRVRYLGWSMGFTMLALVVLFAAMGAAAATAGQGLAMAIYFIGLIPMTVISAFFVIQRLHDLDKSGWLFLLMLVPLVGLFFTLYIIFAPGSQGANRYGNPPPPNSTGVLVLAWLVPVMMVVIGILAAMAIPAYQSYVQKAQEAQMQMQPLEQQQQ